MKRNVIIIIVVIVVVTALAIGALFFFRNNSTAAPTAPTQGNTTSTAQGNTPPGALLLGDTTVSQSDITPGLPPDAPHGATIPFQTAGGTVTLNNFYNDAQGYLAPLNVLLLQHNAAYTIWYYRDNSKFTIVVPASGTMSDADAAATVLATDLGVDQKKLCDLPVDAIFMIDRGMDSQSSPFDFCPAPTP